MSAILDSLHRARVLPLAFAGAMLTVGALPGQQPEPPEPPEPPHPDCVCSFDFGPFGEPGAARSFFRFSRARLGVVLGEPTEVAGRDGVALEAVEDGGPAERAGLREGDILIALDGQALGEDPVEALLDRMGDIEPGDTVAVLYHRDGRDATARVVTDRRPAFGGIMARPGGEYRVFSGREGADLRRMSERMRSLAPVLAHGGWMAHGLELVEVNPGLGQYFGTDEGVLVADVDADSPLGLRPGDVILSIGGREVRDAGHARSIIASYRDDEEVRFEVMRERRRVSVTGRTDR